MDGTFILQLYLPCLEAQTTVPEKQSAPAVEKSKRILTSFIHLFVRFGIPSQPSYVAHIH